MIGSTSRRSNFAALLLAAVALAAGLFFHAQVSAGAPTVSIGSLSKSVGEQGTVALQALDIPAPGLGAWTIDITYDPQVVSVVDCAGGLGGMCNPAYADGTVRVAWFSIFGEIGDSTLATITFACESGGSSQLALTLETFIEANLGGSLPIDASIDDGLAICSSSGPPGAIARAVAGAVAGANRRAGAVAGLGRGRLRGRQGVGAGRGLGRQTRSSELLGLLRP